MNERERRFSAIQSLYETLFSHHLSWRIEFNFGEEVINLQLRSDSQTMFSHYHNRGNKEFYLFPVKNAEKFFEIFESLPMDDWRRFKIKAYGYKMPDDSIEKIREILEIMTSAWRPFVQESLKAKYEVMVNDGLWNEFADQINNGYYL